MEKIKEVLNYLLGFLKTISDVVTAPIFELGSSEISLALILYFFLAVIGIFFVAGSIKRVLIKRVLNRYDVEEGVSQSIGTIVKYSLIVLGLFIIVQTAGIDLSALGILAGALGVGIGFGLQNITNNFISGLIILFERPIKVGDRIEVGDIKGDVVNIAARATTVITNDNISIIVPNSEFISSTVINWSHTDRMVRFKFKVGVAYKEDPEKIREILLEVADNMDGVLESPPPDVLFSDYGDSSIDFTLMVWTIKYTAQPGLLKSNLYFSIFKKLREHGIEIPFPQRDLHIKSGLESFSKV